MAVDNLLKSGPSGGNCSTPDRPFVSNTEANHSENIPLDQMHNLAETADDYSVGNLNNWATPMGKGCVWVGFPNKVVVAVAAVVDNSAAAVAAACTVCPTLPADIQCYSHLEIAALVEMSWGAIAPFRLCPLLGVTPG